MDLNRTEIKNSDKAPFLQRLYDRPFVLLGLGMTSMLVFYTLWGWYELAHMPTSTLP